jgi:phosphoglycerol transferase MdoB-like AlkP superfamily enzyme
MSCGPIIALAVAFALSGCAVSPITVAQNKIAFADSRNYSAPFYVWNGKTYVRHVQFFYHRSPSQFDRAGQARSDAYYRKQEGF